MRKLFFPSSRPSFINPQEVIEGLRQVAQKTARGNKSIRAVYLFGSYAHGQAGFRFDADILIVLSQDKRSRMDRLDDFIFAFAEAPVPADVLVLTQAEMDKTLQEDNRFIKEAMKGIRLV